MVLVLVAMHGEESVLCFSDTGLDGVDFIDFKVQIRAHRSVCVHVRI